jgi:hypothetical protein
MLEVSKRRIMSMSSSSPAMGDSGKGFRGWLVDLAAGGILGGAAGLVVAVNLVIFLGPEQGYESSIQDVFDHSTILGVVVLAILAAGPIVGVLLARRRRASRQIST